jgi:hypothetical protein
MALRLHLPQRNADADPAMAVCSYRRGRLAGKHRHCVSGLYISRCWRSMAAALIEAIGTETVQT